MQLDEAGALLIERFEGFSAYQYRDSVGVPTVGFGTTSADVSPLPYHLSRAQAETLLISKCNSKYAPAVNALGVPMSQNQFDACVSLAYNCGPGVMGWQIGADLRNRNFNAAADDFMRYVYAGGRVLQGLVNRRAAERQLFLTPDRVIRPVNVHHYERFITESHGGYQERSYVMMIDSHNGRWTKHQNKENAYKALKTMRDRIMAVVHQAPRHQWSASWDVSWRWWRWQQMNNRMKELT